MVKLGDVEIDIDVNVKEGKYNTDFGNSYLVEDKDDKHKFIIIFGNNEAWFFEDNNGFMTYIEKSDISFIEKNYNMLKKMSGKLLICFSE